MVIKSLIAVALWLKDIEAFKVLKFRPLGNWILKFQRKGVRSPDADNVRLNCGFMILGSCALIIWKPFNFSFYLINTHYQIQFIPSM